MKELVVNRIRFTYQFVNSISSLVLMLDSLTDNRLVAEGLYSLTVRQRVLYNSKQLPVVSVILAKKYVNLIQ